MLIDLKDKVAIVTGAGRGIGRDIALALAWEGCRTVVTDIIQSNLDDTVLEFQSHGLAVTPYICDVRDSVRIGEVVEDIVSQLGRIDVVVNNAGVLAGGYVEECSEEAWDLSQDVNLKGVFLMCKAVAPIMKQQHWGRIINAASFAAIIPSVGSSAYAATKAGVHYFTRVLAGELGPWGITVNCYAPGMIPTEMNHFAEAPAEQQARLLNTLTLRKWGDKQDVANLICFLASDLAGYITGTMIDVSGGKFATQIPHAAYERASQ